MKRIVILLTAVILINIYCFCFIPFNSSEFEEKLDEITNSKNLPGNRIELIKSGEDFLNRMEELILNAEETINLQTFIFDDDEVGEHFKQLLIDKTNSGVKVKLIVDLWGTTMNKLDFMQELNEELDFRIHFQVSHESEGINHSFHEKYMVVDGKYCILGGANIDDVNLDRYEKTLFGEEIFKPAHSDTNVYLEGPVVGEIQKDFIKNWEYLGTPIQEDLSIYFPEIIPFDDGVYLRFIAQDYTRYEETYINDLFELLIDNTKKSMFFETLYLTPPIPVAKKIVSKAKDGVEIDILSNNFKMHPDAWFGNHLNYNFQVLFYEWFIRRGINIYESYIKVHSKIGIFDEEIAVVGTFNLGHRSFFFDSECVILVKDKQFISELLDYCNERVLNSKKISLE